MKISKVNIMATVFAFIFILAGHSQSYGASAGDENIVEIRERFFLTQMNDIFLNHERYLGRTLRYEGVFFHFYSEGRLYGYVIRHTHGCCGPDGMVGFVALMNDIEPPPANAWVEITGVLVKYEFETGTTPLLLLDAISITEMAERGRAFVEQ